MKSIKQFDGKGNTWLDQLDKKVQEIQDEVSAVLNRAQIEGTKEALSASSDDETRINIILERLKQAEVSYDTVNSDGEIIWTIQTEWEMDFSLDY